MSDPLYQFQVEGISWLKERRTAYLADEMGLGKSVQQIVAADMAGHDFVSVICPAIAVEDWRRKFKVWSTYDRGVYCGYSSTPVLPAAVPRKSVIINGYETAVKHRALFKANRHGGALLVDEAHYVKNPSTIRARALYGGNCAGYGGIVDYFDAVWLASGTPTPNGDPREMWPHLRALRPYSILGPDGSPMSYTDWRDTFCVLQPGLGSDKVIDVRNEDAYKAILRPFMLRREGDVAGLPPVRFDPYPMHPTKIPRELDMAQWPDLTQRLSGIIYSADEGDMDTQLEEEIATLRRLTGLLKVQATVELLEEELRTGQLDRVVVFAYHVDVVNAIARALKKFGAAAITGGTGEKQRWAAIDAFNKGTIQVIVGQILATATNTSLGTCREVVFAETDWVPDNNLQCAYRCRRIDGHRFPVRARIISIAGTVDELVQAAARRKLRQTSKLKL